MKFSDYIYYVGLLLLLLIAVNSTISSTVQYNAFLFECNHDYNAYANCPNFPVYFDNGVFNISGYADRLDTYEDKSYLFYFQILVILVLVLVSAYFVVHLFINRLYSYRGRVNIENANASR